MQAAPRWPARVGGGGYVPDELPGHDAVAHVDDRIDRL